MKNKNLHRSSTGPVINNKPDRELPQDAHDGLSCHAAAAEIPVQENRPASSKNRGILYGIGTGPGDPELLTLKAVRIIKEADVIAVPNEEPASSIPYQTVLSVCPELASREILAVPFLMEPDRAARQEVRRQNAAKIAAVLDQGLNVAFLTLGDPSIYTTYSYVFALLEPLGYTCEMVCGVPSFCAAASRLNITLCSDQEKLEIIPGGIRSEAGKTLLAEAESENTPPYEGEKPAAAEPSVTAPGRNPGTSETSSQPPVRNGLPGCGTGSTQIYMKFETLFPRLIEKLNSRGESPMVIENCCLENERIFRNTASLPEDIGYFNIVISHHNGTED